MAQTFIQKTTATGAAGTSITTPAFAGATVVGNQLVACSAVWNATTGNSITNSDSKTNSWTRDKTQQQAANGGFAVATISNAILAAGKAGTSHTVTVTASLSSSDLQLVAAEFSGSTATVDQSAANTAAASTTTITATTSATTNANDLVVAVMAYSSSSTSNGVLTPANINGSQTGVTSLQVVQDGNTICGVESSYKIISTTGTQAANWTYSSQASGGYAAVVVVYQAAVTSGAKALARFPKKGPQPKSYGPRIIGFEQGIFFPAADTGAISGQSNPSSNAFASATAAVAAAGLACCASIAIASGTVTYAAAGISNPSSVLIGNEGETDVENGRSVVSSVVFGSATVAYAASGIASPSLVTEGSAGTAGALSGISNPNAVLIGDLQLQAASGAIDGRSVPSGLAYGSASIAGELDGVVNAAAVAYGSATASLQASGLGNPSLVALGDLQLVAAGSVNGITVSSSVFFGDVSYTVGTASAQDAGRPAGRRQYREIYRVKVDGHPFEFRTLADALTFLDKTKAAAEELARQVVRNATEWQKASKARIELPTIQPPKIEISSRDLRGAVSETKREIAQIYESAIKDAEIAMLFELKKREEDNEDVIWLL